MRKTRGGWGETGLSPIFPVATAPFPESCASYFRFTRFNTFPLYYLRAWHRLNRLVKEFSFYLWAQEPIRWVSFSCFTAYTKCRLKFKWNKFFVCDRAASLVEVRRNRHYRNPAKYIVYIGHQIWRVVDCPGGGGGELGWGTPDFKWQGWLKDFLGFETFQSGIFLGKQIWQAIFWVA